MESAFGDLTFAHAEVIACTSQVAKFRKPTPSLNDLVECGLTTPERSDGYHLRNAGAIKRQGRGPALSR